MITWSEYLLFRDKSIQMSFYLSLYSMSNADRIILVSICDTNKNGNREN